MVRQSPTATETNAPGRPRFAPVVLTSMLLVAPLLAACPNEECRQMKQCCAAVGHLDWVGDACGPLAENVTDPRTCTTVTQTIRHSFQGRGETAPEVCK